MRASVSSRPVQLLLRLAVVLLLALGVAPAFSGQPAAAANSALTINSHSCPYGTDVASLNYYDLAAACQGQPALDYTINGPNYAQQVSAGLYTASGLEPGTYYVTQGDYSATYGPPVAYCNVDDELGGDVTVGVVTSVVGGSQGPVELAVDGYTAFCDVFNADLTPPATTPGSVTITKYACPDGTPSGQDEATYLVGCTDAIEGVDFSEGAHSGSKSTVTTDVSGQVTFPVDANADWSIEELIPTGYDGNPQAFCAWTGAGTDTNGDPVSAGSYGLGPNGGTTLRFDTYDQFAMSCNWFNILPTTTTTSTDAEVFISKWECPAGHVGDTYDSLQGDCDRELEGISFTITHESGESATDDTGGQPARAAFTPWYNGNSTITELPPDGPGYGTPVVFCYAADDFGDVIPGYELRYYDVTGPSSYTISIEIPTDSGGGIVSFYCDWYNTIDQPTYGGIYVHKYGCPQGYSTDSSVEELSSNCWTIVRGAEFQVEGPGGYADSQTLYDVDVAWENLAPGDYTVSETPPSGYRDSKVYCVTGQYEGDFAGDYEEVDASDGGGVLSVEAGSYVDCVWYNIPPPASTGGPTTSPRGPATLIIVKYTCEAGYDEYAAKADPTEDCDETTDGVSFTLRGGKNSSLTKVTGEDDDPGTVTFANLPAGSYLLQETYPDDVSSAFVWECASTVRGWVYAFAPFAVIGPDGTTKVNVVPGETLTCSWYDVPSPEGTGGEANVSVAVLDCPGDQVTQSSCDPAAAGVAVDLTADGTDGADVSLETDAEGIAAGEVDPGAYNVEVDAGSCFADSDAFDDDGLLTVGDDPVEVTIYRCDAE